MLWQLEFTNVLNAACDRGKLEIDTARQIIDAICAMPIENDQDTPGPRQIFELATRYKLSGYDGAYLEVAIRLGLPIACLDSRLREASIGAGVTVI